MTTSTYRVEFTETEKDVLFMLLDAANRSKGINEAENCIYIVKKVLAGKTDKTEDPDNKKISIVQD